jgi:hypothetical protein
MDPTPWELSLLYSHSCILVLAFSLNYFTSHLSDRDTAHSLTAPVVPTEVLGTQ